MHNAFVQELLKLDNDEQVKAALQARSDELEAIINQRPLFPPKDVLAEYAEIQIALDTVGVNLFWYRESNHE